MKANDGKPTQLEHFTTLGEQAEALVENLSARSCRTRAASVDHQAKNKGDDEKHGHNPNKEIYGSHATLGPVQNKREFHGFFRRAPKPKSKGS